MSGRKGFQATDERSMWTISEEELKERETGEQWKECRQQRIFQTCKAEH